ncbi:MAG: enoyl-CoA hydratase/isomerase family protein [Alphaproteobacteria bacterium]|nr:enoyl-CoA hydratase/isomerase family protein [Alphaproteobacteria bacterium]MBO4644392.1 enoyl-CoA hydratase/isomerase family protein [Alphaproteobacteria bacterium]
MDFETITVENSGAIGLITLNRPASMNAVCAAMLYELAQAVRDFDAEKSIRVIVLKGTEEFFAAGTDMSEFIAAQNGIDADGGLYGNSVRTIASCSKPIVAAVAGYAFGGGLELVLLSDVVIAADNARFGFPEITLGVLPQMGGVSLLTNRIGRAKAADLLLTGRHISAEEALACGLISRVVDSADLLNEVSETAERIAAMPAAGVRLVKQAILNACETSLRNEETIAQLSLMSADAREGLRALKEDRAPKFEHK